ncbi:MAG: AMP-binding protein [Chloroflexi bacterium]|nr:AMP-binding protein [Chloroflexota bacterium]
MTDTLPGLLEQRAQDTPNGVALRQKRLGIWQELTWREYHDRVRSLAAGLQEIGLRPGDVVALVGGHRTQWLIAELGIQAAGGVVAPLDAEATIDVLSDMLRSVRPRFAIVEGQEEVDHLLELRPNLPSLERVIYWEPRGMRAYRDSWLLPLWEDVTSPPTPPLKGRGANGGDRRRIMDLSKSKDVASNGTEPTVIEHTREQIEGDQEALPLPLRVLRGDIGAPADLEGRKGVRSTAEIIFTPGTDGPPRPEWLTHANLIAAARSLVQTEGLDRKADGSVATWMQRLPWIGNRAVRGVMSFAPNCWIGDRVFATTCALVAGYPVNLPEEPETVGDDIQEIGPEIIAAPPKAWQRLEATARAKAGAAGRVRLWVYRWALDSPPRSDGKGSPLSTPIALRTMALLTLLCAVLVIIGSLGVWADEPAADLSANGTEGGGIITLVLAGIAAASMLWRFARPRGMRLPVGLASLMFLTAILAVAANWPNVSRMLPETDNEVNPGTGIRLVLLGSLVGLVFCVLQSSLKELLVYRPVRDHLGLTRLTHAYSTAAPLPDQTARFFRTIGVPLKQLYLVTAAGGPLAVGQDAMLRVLPGIDVSVAEDGEVVVRAPVPAGSPPDEPEPDRRNGPLRTGDHGRTGPDGSLTLLDRATHAGRLADGTVLLPAEVEKALTASPYIRHAVAVGDGRPYVAALLSIDGPAVRAWAEHRGASVTTYGELSQLPEVRDLVRTAVQSANAGLPERLHIGRFAILDRELSADTGEATRLGTARRGVVLERWSSLVEVLYGERVDRDAGASVVALEWETAGVG